MTEKDEKPRALRRSQVVLEYIKALAWPVFAIVLLVSFWQPLQDIAKVAPGLVSQSESIQIGSVSLKVKARLAKQASEAVQTVLRRLQPEDILEILSISTSYREKQAGGTMLVYDDDDGSKADRYARFAELKIVTALSGPELEVAKKTNERPTHVTRGYRLSGLWDETYGFLIRLTLNVLEEADRQAEAQTNAK